MKTKLDLSYPRPLFKRANFINLNGEWDFLLEESDVGERNPRYKEFPKEHLKIKVPFCYQCEESGINNKKRVDTVWYQKDVLFARSKNERVILHFDAADYLTYVYVNEKLVGTHKGGYTSFEFDITDYLIDNKAHIAVRCDDSYDLHQPRGKQKWKPENFGCWYQEVTGIWKSVWAEIVPETYIKNFKMTPVKNGAVNVKIAFNRPIQDTLLCEILSGNKIVSSSEHSINGDSFEFNQLLNEIHYWSLEDPYLYSVRFTLSSGDQVNSIFGYRFIETKNGEILLNGNPLFMRLTLEQGYYKEGIYTFKDEQQILDEIYYIKSAGFNGLRMHQKVEDDRFYYLCDVMGLVVWSEMPSAYDFDEVMVENTKREWEEIVNQHYNHPSILVWTPCNESWGVPGIRKNKEQHQFLIDMYDLTKKLDSSRLVVSNDGWQHCKTDLVTLHNYIQEPDKFKKEFIDQLMEIVLTNEAIYHDGGFAPFAEGFKYEGQPILIDEFCGIGFNIDSVQDGWGYGDQVKNEKEFLNRYNELIKLATNCKVNAGWCMTQITDVYQEVNGLFTFDRRSKFDLKEVHKINTQPRIIK